MDWALSIFAAWLGVAALIGVHNYFTAHDVSQNAVDRKRAAVWTLAAIVWPVAVPVALVIIIVREVRSLLAISRKR